MNRFFAFQLVLFALIHITITEAHADVRGSHGPRRMKADADGDGKISLREFQDAQAARAATVFRQMDRNSDGFLSQDEMKAGRQQRQQQQRKHHRRQGESRV